MSEAPKRAQIGPTLFWSVQAPLVGSTFATKHGTYRVLEVTADPESSGFLYTVEVLR